MSESFIIDARRLHKSFQQGATQVHALRGVDFRIASGEFVVIAGPSGSGKSTLLNILGLLDTPTRGELIHDGCNISGLSKRALSGLRRDKLGFVFQAYNLMPVLTALENTEMVMEFQGVERVQRRQRASEMLIRLGLEREMHRYPDQLSGGQQQRVAVARAIAGRPKLVIADEPTANLDSLTAESLMDLMVSLNQEHAISFVFSSHDPQVISRARRVVRLRDGCIDDEQQSVAPVRRRDATKLIASVDG